MRTKIQQGLTCDDATHAVSHDVKFTDGWIFIDLFQCFDEFVRVNWNSLKHTAITEYFRPEAVASQVPLEIEKDKPWRRKPMNEDHKRFGLLWIWFSKHTMTKSAPRHERFGFGKYQKKKTGQHHRWPGLPLAQNGLKNHETLNNVGHH